MILSARVSQSLGGGGWGGCFSLPPCISRFLWVYLGLYPRQWMSGCGIFLIRSLILGPRKPQASVYRGWARAVSWYLGWGPAPASRSGLLGRAEPGAGLSDRSGIFCPLLVALRPCSWCRVRRREGPGSRSGPLCSSERTWKSSPTTVPADPPGTQTPGAASHPPPPSLTNPFPCARPLPLHTSSPFRLSGGLLHFSDSRPCV